MPYTPRTFTDIVQTGTNAFIAANPGITDFNVGSVTRSMLEAIWLELSRYYTNLDQAVNDAQENATYLTFGFAPLPAQAAFGRVLFTLSSNYVSSVPLVIPAGASVFVGANPRFSYTTTSDVTLSLSSSTAEVTAIAVSSGALYNVGPNAINSYAGTGSAFVSVTNPRAFITGADAETEIQRRARFGQFVTGFPRGTYGSILYGLKTTVLADVDGYPIERVAKASSIEYAPGEIHCWVHNGIGNTSMNLVAQAQRVLSGYTDSMSGITYDGYKAAGIHSYVYAATEIPVAVQATIELQVGFLAASVVNACSQAVSIYLQSLDVGENARVESIKQAIRSQPGVLDIVSVSTPTINTVADFAHICVPGNIAISVQAAT
jgi:hypothetical protein